MYLARYAILLDGGFVTRKLKEKLGRPALADDIIDLCNEIRANEHLKSYELMRIYYYDAPPSGETILKPVSNEEFPLSSTERYRHSQSLYDQLELKDGVAIRMGETRLTPQQWKMKPRSAKQLIKTPRAITDKDFDLDIGQKGVDIRIGLDMARLALRDTVRAVAVVTGDSDFVPAFKFVRREGVKVMLCTLGHKGARRELKAHADFVLS
ncbi:NYN domain-containing protein [Mesorhizobium denitrificans]|uniref:NYN domain-containing protein n=1 Tax=Mesorhizobium denitrificans TaxID=2294114 RepID=A0A371XET5_9HYPH|nr:NYN domain-containing protein [Mesorhizobium denitrificans]RFC67703.1 NYN domain-containing protein [Mesorhizobium denitrificans]